MRLLIVLLLFCISASGQTISYFNQGFLRQPSAELDRNYIGVSSSLATSNLVWVTSNALYAIGASAYVKKAGDKMSGPLTNQIVDPSYLDNLVISNLTVIAGGLGWNGTTNVFDKYGLLMRIPFYPLISFEQTGQGTHPALSAQVLRYGDNLYYGTFYNSFLFSDLVTFGGVGKGTSFWAFSDAYFRSNSIILQTNFSGYSVASSGFYGNGSGLTNLPIANIVSPGAIVTNGMLDAVVLAASVSATNFIGNAAGLSNIWNTVSVTDYGANGADLASDQAAFTAALSSGAKTVLVPDGTYYLTNVVIPSNVHLVGLGRPTLAHGTYNLGNYLLDSHLATNYTISNFILDGRGTASFKTTPTGVNGAGIYCNSTYANALIQNCLIKGFGYAGVVSTVVGSVNVGEGLTFVNVSVINSHKGFWLAAGGEYMRFINCAASYCYMGAYVSPGNVLFNGCSFGSCGTGLMVGGTGNNGHGSFVGGQLNHCTTGLILTNIPSTLGYEVSSLNIFSSNISLTNCTNVCISGIFGSDVNLSTSGSGTNYISGQWMTDSGLPNSIVGGTNLILNGRDYLIGSKSFSGSLTATNSITSLRTVTGTNFTTSTVKWIDVPMNYSASTLGPNAPALTAVTNGSVIQELAFDNNDILYAQGQFSHNVAVTNALFPSFYFEPHVHFTTIGTLDATHSNVTWRCEWQVAAINGGWFSGTNSITMGVTNNHTHYMAELGHITNNALNISSIFRCRLMRPASVAQDYSNAHDVLLDAFDLHIPVGNLNAIGSSLDNSP